MSAKQKNNPIPQSKLKKYFLLATLLFLGYNQINAQLSLRDSLQGHIENYRSSQNFNPKDSLYIDLLNNLGSEMRYFKSDSLLLLSQQALELSKASNNDYGQCKSLIGIGDYYIDKGNYDHAITHYQKALTEAKELEDKDLIIDIKNSIAGAYDFKGDYAEALSRYLEGIELATATGNDLMLSILNENIANLYATQKNYTQAIHFYKIVKRINDKIGNDIYSAETMSNIASVYADMGELEYAMFNVNSSIATFEKHKIMDWLAYAYEVKGKTYLKEGDNKWALFFYKQSEMIHENLEDDRGETSLLNGIAIAYLGQGNDSLSEQYALKAFELSKKIKFHEETEKSANTLYKIYKNKKDFGSALGYHEIYQTLRDTISTNKNKKSITMLVTKLEFEKQKESLMEENSKALASQKRYIYAALLILIIFLTVTIIVRRNEKIQKRLNTELYIKTAKLVENEKELRDINETKDKLFSIIGHDLRGPIAAFQGLLKLYKQGEIGGEEFLQFIPKLSSDIEHISFTLNNLLSWGRTQMNGSVTKPGIVSLENLVNENINLLSETAEAKSINIVNKMAPNTLSWSDGDQIDIVIRNLISNALKFTPENGLITIDAMERSSTWEIAVRDTGVGIDPEIQNKIFEKNSNITTYGTNDEKGTGLGLSLCKEMVEKNNGKIWVESLMPNGSCFYFTLPKLRDKFQRAG
ncbi:MAG: tetratricopeptide repeat-containing sensor histidine kinase [Maribacter sp.]|nr:tetratricopeptide repeat-containing sensor histidine kinase [Maribacter sp.]